MPCKRRKLLKFARKRGLAEAEGGKHLKLFDSEGNMMPIPRGSKHKELEDCYVRQFARIFGFDEDEVWDNVR